MGFPSSVDAGGGCEAIGAVEVLFEDVCDDETKIDDFSPADGDWVSDFLCERKKFMVVRESVSEC